MTDGGPTPYDVVSYPGHPVPETHPDRLAVLGTLYGMEPTPVSRCRVLELGCGTGGNLLPIAYQWPESEFVGVDLSKGAIEKASRRAADLGLSNVELHNCNIMDVTDEFGKFDYIVAHGVYSWVPPQVRERMLAIFGANLAPQGIAYVSYNSHPWSHLRDLTREMMLFHVRGTTDPHERVQQGRGLLDFLSQVIPENDVYGRVVRQQYARVMKIPDEVLYHDDLDAASTAFWLHEVVRDATHYGLQYLSEAGFRRPNLGDYPEKVGEIFSDFPETEIVAREQYQDFITGNGFRRTLLCHADVDLRRSIDPQIIKNYYISTILTPASAESDTVKSGVVEFNTQKGETVATDHPLSKAALLHLSECSPRAVSFADLLDGAMARLAAEADRIDSNLDAEINVLTTVLYRIFSVGHVHLHLDPPTLTTTISERPEASLLARKQAEMGPIVTNLRHRSVRLEDELTRRFVLLLDGTRTIDQLVSELHIAVETSSGAAEGHKAPVEAALADVSRDKVEENLRSLGQLGLLVQ